jgi:peptidoglycan/LPS O-acetylase OafA/YrhL
MPWIGPGGPARTICSDTWPHAWATEVAAHLTMTHGLFPDAVLPDVWVSLLGAAWSLSTEWQFYLLAVLLAGRPRTLVWVLLALAAAGAAWRAGGPVAWQFSRAFIANKGHFFALGVASLPLLRRQAGAAGRYRAVLAACLLACATAGAAGKLLPPLAWTACLGVVLWPEAPGWHLAARALGCRAARYLGAISYCVYLVNEPVHKVLARAVGWLSEGDALVFTALWLPAAVLVPVAVSALLHRWLEAPAMRWGHGGGKQSHLR